ncbi:MAG TPA: NfeD family protein [Opitutaceae bacterium]|nr:NfeD family protein [Opitutaceae bacterium]
MRGRLLQLLGALLALAGGALAVRGADATGPRDGGAPIANMPEAKPVRIYVIPVRTEIGSAVLYIVRRGMKDAIAQHADAVILDMKTPGGALDTTFDIMEAIAKFPGTTITYVDSEAMSAGAFISATTNEIWFAPDGIIGAAAPVQAGGQDVEATMKQKIVSYLKARVRALSEGKGYRGEVISAMIDADHELKIGDKVIKEKGELLSLTASEAAKTYGDPPRALLSAGTATSVSDLIAQRFPGARADVSRLEVTWSERLAVWLNTLAPVLLGLGMLALFIEFKTPGFGAFGITGIALLAVVFLSSYVAGLSGHEPLLFFGVGVLLVLLELIFWHSAGFLGAAGVGLMAASLLWSMADLWPNEPLTVAWSAHAFVPPMVNLGLGLVIALALFAALLRFLPSGWVWDRLVVQTTSGGIAQVAGAAADAAAELAQLVGQRGIAATALHPSGQVEIAGRRYEAQVAIGVLDRGAPVIVTGASDFALTVERADA